MTTKITVVTAVLNQAKALRSTIESVLETPYPNLDYVIVDGASVDGTLDVIKDVADRLTAWTSEPDTGVYDAMNKGWRLADHGGYVLFLGAGDRLVDLPASIPPPTEQPTVYFGRVLLGEGREFISCANWRLKLYNALHHQGLLVPKSLHPEPPFDTNFRLYADFDFNQRLLKGGVNFVPLAGFVASASPGGMTAMTDVTEINRIVRKNFGMLWGGLSLCGFLLARRLPVLRKFRPIR